MTTPVAAQPRPRASVAAIAANLNALDDNQDDPRVFNGASKFSDNRELGRMRLDAVRQQDTRPLHLPARGRGRGRRRVHRDAS